MGAQEMTRYGMKEDDFRELARLVAEVMREGGREEPGFRRDAVIALRRRFATMRYCMGDQAD